MSLRPSARTIFQVFFVALSLVLGAELAVRAATSLQNKWDLERFPRIADALADPHSVLRHLRLKDILGSPGEFPAPVRHTRDGVSSVSYVPVGEMGPHEFPRPPASEEPTPGVVRVAFFGGSTTSDGHPEVVARLFDSAFGPGRVEVINAGVSAAGSTMSLVLMKKFIPRWKPHLVVYYDGVNDLMFERSWVLATGRAMQGNIKGDEPAFLALTGSRGLLDVLRDGWAPEAVPALDPWMRGAVMEKPWSNYFEMSRLAWSTGSELVVSTFAAPDPSKLSDEDGAYLDADIRFLWPALGSRQRYLSRLEVYNARVKQFAALTRTRLIDVAGISGGLETFTDNCHFTPEGITQHARIVFEALRGPVAELLAKGAPPVSTRTKEPARSLAASTTLPRTGNHQCVQGPCPDGSCYVPAGNATLGAPELARVTAVTRMRNAVGWGDPHWFDDDVEPVPVKISAFCIDRTEAPEADVRRCRDDGACPPDDESLSVSSPPAIVPTAADAEAYCAWKGGRLPTDAEWDWAARGPAATVYPWGDDWTGHEANYCGKDCHFGVQTDPADGYAGPAPIGAFHSPSPFGAEDMAGNMWEWVADCFFDGSHAASRDVRDPLVSMPPASCDRYLRGGSYASFGGLLERRLAEGTPEMAVPTRGVRCVYDFGTTFTVLKESDRPSAQHMAPSPPHAERQTVLLSGG